MKNLKILTVVICVGLSISSAVLGQNTSIAELRKALEKADKVHEEKYDRYAEAEKAHQKGEINDEELQRAYDEESKAYLDYKKAKNDLEEAERTDEKKRKEYEKSRVTKGVQTQTPLAPSMKIPVSDCRCQFLVHEEPGKPYSDVEFKSAYDHQRFSTLSLLTERGLFAVGRAQAYDAQAVSPEYKAEVEARKFVQSVSSFRVEHKQHSSDEHCEKKPHKAILSCTIQPQFTVNYKTVEPSVFVQVSFFMSVSSRNFNASMEYKDKNAYNSGSTISASAIMTGGGPAASAGLSTPLDSYTSAPKNQLISTSGPEYFEVDVTSRSDIFKFSTGWKHFSIGAENTVYAPGLNLPFVGASALGKLIFDGNENHSSASVNKGPERRNVVEAVFSGATESEIDIEFKETDWNFRIDGYCGRYQKGVKELLVIENRNTTPSVKFKK